MQAHQRTPTKAAAADGVLPTGARLALGAPYATTLCSKVCLRAVDLADAHVSRHRHRSDGPKPLPTQLLEGFQHKLGLRRHAILKPICAIPPRFRQGPMHARPSPTVLYRNTLRVRLASVTGRKPSRLGLVHVFAVSF